MKGNKTPFTLDDLVVFYEDMHMALDAYLLARLLHENDIRHKEETDNEYTERKKKTGMIMTDLYNTFQELSERYFVEYKKQNENANEIFEALRNDRKTHD